MSFVLVTLKFCCFSVKAESRRYLARVSPAVAALCSCRCAAGFLVLILVFLRKFFLKTNQEPENFMFLNLKKNNNANLRKNT